MNQRIAMRPLKFTALLLCTVLLIACDGLSGQAEDEGDPLDFENVEPAKYLKVEKAQTAVFRSEADWETFWYEHILSTRQNLKAAETSTSPAQVIPAKAGIQRV